MRRCDTLRDDHPPGVDDQLGHLRLVDGGQPDAHPVVPLVRTHRHEELLGITRDQRRPLLARESEAHERLVRDRKSTRLNSSHEWISYAVFCLKKKKVPLGVDERATKVLLITES